MQVSRTSTSRKVPWRFGIIPETLLDAPAFFGNHTARSVREREGRQGFARELRTSAWISRSVSVWAEMAQLTRGLRSTVDTSAMLEEPYLAQQACGQVGMKSARSDEARPRIPGWET